MTLRNFLTHCDKGGDISILKNDHVMVTVNGVDIKQADDILSDKLLDREVDVVAAKSLGCGLYIKLKGDL